LSFGDTACLLNVFIGWHLVLYDRWVDRSLRDFKSILSPGKDIQVSGFFLGDVVLFDEIEGGLSDILPLFITEWKIGIASKFISNGVPDSVQIVSSFTVRKIYKIAAEVALGVLVIDASCGVQRLVHVTYVMNKEPHSS